MTPWMKGHKKTTGVIAAVLLLVGIGSLSGCSEPGNDTGTAVKPLVETSELEPTPTEDATAAAEQKAAEEKAAADKAAADAAAAAEAQAQAEKQAARQARKAARLAATKEAERKARLEQSAAEAREQQAKQVYYENCTAVRDAGADPIYAGDPGFADHLDRDGDGVACE